MADQPISALSNTFSAGYNVGNELEILDVADTTFASTGTNKRISVGTLLEQYIAAGTGITVNQTGAGVTIASTASGGLTSVGLAVPTGLTVSGSPLTSNGTITVGCGVSGMLKGVSGGAISAAVAGTDYVAPTGSGANLTGITASQICSVPSGMLKGASGAISSCTAGTDYVAASGSGASLTGITASQIGCVPSGMLKGASGVISAGTAGTDYLTPTGSGAGLSGVVLTTGSYASPSWLTAISGGIVSGNISGNAASITGSITTSQISNLGSWAGSTAITTLGAIATGTWQGTTVGVQYGGTGANLASTGGTSNYLKQSSRRCGGHSRHDHGR